jgi:hypothetical protein
MWSYLWEVVEVEAGSQFLVATTGGRAGLHPAADGSPL